MLNWSLQLYLVIAGDEVVRVSCVQLIYILMMNSQLVDDFLYFFFWQCPTLYYMDCADVLSLWNPLNFVWLIYKHDANRLLMFSCDKCVQNGITSSGIPLVLWSIW